MKHNFALTICLIISLLFASTTCWAIPVSGFQDIDTHIAHSQDIVIAKCVKVPDKGILGFEDGLYPADVNVVSVLKGDKKPGELKIATIYPMKVGRTYLLSSFGGSAFGADFLAVPELSVVPIPDNFDLDSLKQRPVKEQMEKIFAMYLRDVQEELRPLLEKQALLEKALKHRTDDLFKSNSLHLINVKELTTAGKGMERHFELPPGNLEWSHQTPGKSGYVYYVEGNGPRWEFAKSDRKTLHDFEGQPLEVHFLGSNSPGSNGNSTVVTVGDIILARTEKEPGKIYIIEFIDQNKEEEQSTIRYATVKPEEK